MKVLPYGDRALLLQLADTAAVLSCADALAADASLAALVDDVVPGARTLLVCAPAGVELARMRAALTSAASALPTGPEAAPSAESGVEIEIPVKYEGPDLADVGELTGLGAAGVVAAHTGTAWRVAFGGFAPGFGYLVGGDPRLAVPRRESPRTRVPAGSVGLAGEFSGVYPRASPGGWQLIGRTDAPMWDPDRDPPALLAPGAFVRFVEA